MKWNEETKKKALIWGGSAAVLVVVFLVMKNRSQPMTIASAPVVDPGTSDALPGSGGVGVGGYSDYGDLKGYIDTAIQNAQAPIDLSPFLSVISGLQTDVAGMQTRIDNLNAQTAAPTGATSTPTVSTPSSAVKTYGDTNQIAYLTDQKKIATETGNKGLNTWANQALYLENTIADAKAKGNKGLLTWAESERDRLYKTAAPAATPTSVPTTSHLPTSKPTVGTIAKSAAAASAAANIAQQAAAARQQAEVNSAKSAVVSSGTYSSGTNTYVSHVQTATSGAAVGQAAKTAEQNNQQLQKVQSSVDWSTAFKGGTPLIH